MKWIVTIGYINYLFIVMQVMAFYYMSPFFFFIVAFIFYAFLFSL